MVGEDCERTFYIHKGLLGRGGNEDLSRLAKHRVGVGATGALQGLQNVILCDSWETWKVGYRLVGIDQDLQL